MKKILLRSDQDYGITLREAAPPLGSIVTAVTVAAFPENGKIRHDFRIDEIVAVQDFDDTKARKAFMEALDKAGYPQDGWNIELVVETESEFVFIAPTPATDNGFTGDGTGFTVGKFIKGKDFSWQERGNFTLSACLLHLLSKYLW